jgi:hypothetical protein
MTDVEDKIKKIDLAATGQKIRRAIVEALEALNIYALPEPTEEDVGKTLVVDENGEWVIGDLPAGGVLLLPIKLDLIPPVPLRIRLTLSEGEGNMAIIDTTNAKIEPIAPLIPNSWFGLSSDVYLKQENSSDGNTLRGSISRSSSNATASMGITATMTWAGNEIYLAATSTYKPILKISGISYEVGDTLALNIGITIEG